MKEPQVFHWIFAVQEFKQKLKNVLSEQHNAMAEMKMEGVATAMLVQNRNMEVELGLRRDVHSLNANQREKEQHTQNSFRELQLVRAASASSSPKVTSYLFTSSILLLHRSTRWS